MPSASPLGRSVVVLVSLLMTIGFAGCGRPKSADAAAVIPDFTKKIAENARWRAYHLDAFQIEHMWAGIGHPTPGEASSTDYRAKVLVWRYVANQPPALVAHLYFHDPDRFEPLDRHRNPDPNAKGDEIYQLHFPLTSLGPIIATLRSANDPVYLYYYDNEWSIGIPGAEPVGSE